MGTADRVIRILAAIPSRRFTSPAASGELSRSGLASFAVVFLVTSLARFWQAYVLLGISTAANKPACGSA
jgi:hypothetical protein